MSSKQRSSIPGDSNRGIDWRSTLYDNLRDSANPLFLFRETTIPAASIWTGSRHWVRTFREHNLGEGDRIVIDLPPGPEFIQVIVAVFWEKLSAILIPPDEPPRSADHFDAVARIVREDGIKACSDWVCESIDGPEITPDELNHQSQPKTPQVRFWLRTSGSTGKPNWIGLSDTNLGSVVKSHNPRLNHSNKLLSYLPWNHCFGFVFDLLHVLTTEKTLVRDYKGGSSIKQLIDLMMKHEADHLNSVPIIVKKLLREDSFDILSTINDGIVGGAPVDSELSNQLNGSRFRVGYGQTEASPGIALGQRGSFDTHYLGEPLGCQARIKANDVLEFYGNNTHVGLLSPGNDPSFETLQVPRWQSTGDLVEYESGKLHFKGRIDHRMKLPNGRFISPVAIEQKLADQYDEDMTFFLTQDGSERLILIAPKEITTEERIKETLFSIIGEASNYLDEVIFLDQEKFAFTSKGTLDRVRTQESIPSEKI